MSLLYFLEEIRSPILDFLFSLITLFGEETIFMAVGMIIFWCVNKNHGYYLLCTGFVGTVLNQFLKMFFRVPRPWVKDPAFTIVESAREGAGGYSFPSGHTQTSVGLYGCVALRNKNRWVRILSILLCLLVPLSRLYLGVHTPLDVGVSFVLALILVFGLSPLFRLAEKKPWVMFAILFTLLFGVIAYLFFVFYYPFPENVFWEENVLNLLSARKNGFTLLGCLLGLIGVYYLDEKYIRFDTRAPVWVQIIKTAGGLLLVMSAKELLRFPLDAILPKDTWARMIRYCLMVILGGAVWPLSFRYFSKLDKNGGKCK